MQTHRDCNNGSPQALLYTQRLHLRTPSWQGRVQMPRTVLLTDRRWLAMAPTAPDWHRPQAKP